MNHTELGKSPRLFMLSSLACAWLGLAACSDGAQSVGDGEAGSDAGGTVGGLGGAATGGAGEPSAAGSGDGGTGGLGGTQCPVSPLPLTCGDRFAHSTIDQGHPDQYGAYACSARGYDGRESVYAFSTLDHCQVEVRIEDMAVDLNLFIAPGCDPSACSECIPDDSRMVMTTRCSFSPIPAQDSEIVTFDAVAGESTTVIIDGYDQAQGSYTITAECTCAR